MRARLITRLAVVVGSRPFREKTVHRRDERPSTSPPLSPASTWIEIGPVRAGSHGYYRFYDGES